MKLHYFPLPDQANVMSTEELRAHFHIGGLFQAGQVIAHYTDLDRMIVGAAVPTTAPLGLPHDKALGTSFFLERREIGILNIGAPGTVVVGGQKYDIVMEYFDNFGGAYAQLSWSSASQVKQIIPQGQLYPPNAAPSPWQDPPTPRVRPRI